MPNSPVSRLIDSIKDFLRAEANKPLRIAFVVSIIVFLSLQIFQQREIEKHLGPSLLLDLLESGKTICVIVATSALLEGLRPFVQRDNEHDGLITALLKQLRLEKRDAANIQVHGTLDLDLIAQYLEHGDILKVLTTWQARFLASDDYFTSLMARGVAIRVLMYDPNSSQVTLREAELNWERSGENEIPALILKLKRAQQRAHDGSASGTLEYRLLDRPVRSPAYLICRGKDGHGTDKVVRAFTGFYLDKSDESNLYLEWHLRSEAGADDKTGAFLAGINALFDRMWDALVAPAKPPAAPIEK